MKTKLPPWVNCWSKRLLLTVLWVGGLGTLFYGIENWRAKRALAEHYEWLRSKGESLDPAQFDPPPVPDEDNAALIPVFECFYTKDANGKRVWAINEIGDVPEELPEEQKEKLRAWARLENGLRVIRQIPRAEDGSLDFAKCATTMPKNYRHLADYASKPNMPAALPDNLASPLEKMRAFWDQFKPLLDGLRLAGTRHHCVWPPYSPTLGYPQHVSLSTSVAKALFLDVAINCYTHTAGALVEDLKSLEVFALGSSTEPGLMSGLIFSSQWKLMRRAMEVILNSSDISDDDWSSVASHLPMVDIRSLLRKSLRGERNRIYGFKDMTAGEWSAYIPFDESNKGRYFVGYLFVGPSGWLTRNAISIGESHQKLIATLNGGNSPILKEFCSSKFETEASLFTALDQTKYDFRAYLETAATAEALQLASVAIALKRYQIKHGAFPGDLTQVIPEFLPKLPQSYFNAMTPKYRRMPNESFKLWFYGLDGDDDDGRPQDQTKGSDPKHDYDIVFMPGPAIP